MAQPPHFDPPPGQGHYNQYPEAGYDDRFENGPRQPYRESGYVPYSDSYDSSAGAPPHQRDPYAYANGASAGYEDRPYAPSEPRPHSFNQLSPYDEEKAEAEWNQQQAQQQHAQQRAYPPPRPAGAFADYGREPSYDGRRRYSARDYDDKDSDYDYYDRDYERERDRRHRRRRSGRYSEDSIREKALRYPNDPKKGGRDFLGSSEGERGMGAQLLGGAAGALAGQKFAKGGLGTVGGAVLGAIAAGAGERLYEKRRDEKVYASRRGPGDPYAEPAGPYPPPGRDMEDVRMSGRDGGRPVGGLRERLRSLSRGARSRVRSLSRTRSRRSPSMESDETYHYR